MDSMETKKKLTTILIHVILIIVSITMLVPFIWMILTAFKTVTEATSVDPFTIFPKIWRKDAFISVINNMNFLLLYKNSSVCGSYSNYGRLCIWTTELQGP